MARFAVIEVWASAALGCVATLGCGAATDPDEGGGEVSTATATRTGTETTPGDGTNGGTGQDGGASGGGFKFDVGTDSDAGVGDCDCTSASAFSFIWVANSPESTVTKINTTTVTEEGRYLTDPASDGNPSRTSVSISGRAVAVANRHGGLVKIFANLEDCIESNGMAGIQTSTGAADVLPFMQDECVHWYRDFAGWTVQRPVAWAPGNFNEATCQWEDEVVWTAGCGGGSPGYGGDSTTHVHLIDGETGMDIMTVDLDDYACTGFGPYGGAVDSEGNYWMVQNNGALAFVNRTDFSHAVYPKSANASPYGLTVDSKGRPWVTSYSQTVGAARFDPVTMMWAETTDPVITAIGQTGIAQGADGRVWVGGTIAGSPGVASIDPETLTIVDIIAADSQGKGISLDGEGNVWRAGWTQATRIDPDTGAFDVYVGLNGSYTYSDMTGHGVANAAGCSPVG